MPISRKENAVMIREEWFHSHRATVTEHDGLKVLNWKREGTIAYVVRYVFDGHRMYVTGDLGEAVFCFTEKSDVYIQAQYDLDYFEKKIRAYHGSKRAFDTDQAVARLREWLKRLKDREVEYDHDEMRDFFEAARECSSTDEWTYIINRNEFIHDIDWDSGEWMYSAGDVVPLRLHSYLIGLKMAAEQLKVEADNNVKRSE